MFSSKLPRWWSTIGFGWSHYQGEMNVKSRKPVEEYAVLIMRWFQLRGILQITYYYNPSTVYCCLNFQQIYKYCILKYIARLSELHDIVQKNLTLKTTPSIKTVVKTTYS